MTQSFAGGGDAPAGRSPGRLGSILTTSGSASALMGRAMRYRRPLVPALLCSLAVVALALSLPVSAPVRGTEADAGLSLGSDASPTAAEDLSAFAASRRWGGASLRQIRELIAQEKEAPTEQVPEPPSVDAVGFVGIATSAHDQVALLALANGEVLRVSQGKELEDGRTLASLTDNRITLERDGGEGERDVMALFPEVAPYDQER